MAWALWRGVDLFVIGEWGFGTIAVAAMVLGIFAVGSAVDLYTSGLRAEGTVLEIRQTLRTETEEVTRPDGSERRRDVEQTPTHPSCASSRSRAARSSSTAAAAATPPSPKAIALP